MQDQRDHGGAHAVEYSVHLLQIAEVDVEGAAVLGVAALVGIAGHYAILKDDDDDDDGEGRDALFKTALNKCSQRK